MVSKKNIIKNQNFNLCSIVLILIIIIIIIIIIVLLTNKNKESFKDVAGGPIYLFDDASRMLLTYDSRRDDNAIETIWVEHIQNIISSPTRTTRSSTFLASCRTTTTRAWPWPPFLPWASSAPARTTRAWRSCSAS